MTAGNTYTPIATYTIPATVASTYTFSSISGSYTDLILVYEGIHTGNGDIRIQYNGDTGANYSNNVVKGDGSTVTVTRANAATYIYLAYTDPSTRTMVIAHIQNYANTTTNKTLICKYGTAATSTGLISGMWASTVAITSITISSSVYNFSTGSTFSLYGILAA